MATREEIVALFAEPEFNPQNYKGETDENGLPHGSGKMKYEKRMTKYWLGYSDHSVAPKSYTGEWCHGVKSGEGKMTFYADDCQHYSYTGTWADNLPEGSGVLRVIDARNCESNTPCNFVEGWREGRNTTIEFGKIYDCQWREGLKQGEGICTLEDGRQYKGEWEDDKLQLESCSYVEAKDIPTLIVEIRHEGFDYRRRLVALVEGTEGEYIIGDVLPIVQDKGFSNEELLVTILGLEGGALKYRVEAHYSDNDTPVYGVISVGQSIKHEFCKKCKATIYDDDYDYEIVRSITIHYK